MEKDYLTGRGIAYSEKLVDLDDEAKKAMLIDSGGFLGVPFTVITGDDGTKETVLGFDRNKLDSIIIK